LSDQKGTEGEEMRAVAFKALYTPQDRLAARANRMPYQAAASLPESTFTLTASDPSYRTPAFIGNGAFSLVSTPLGISPAPSYAAGVYDRGPGDVPRIALLPAWNTFNLSQGGGWLNDAKASSLESYGQTLDMFAGTLRTSYQWHDGARRISVEALAFVSRADPNLAVIHLRLVPHDSGRMRVMFPLQEWPPPHRLALARVDKSPTGAYRGAVWYPGHLVVTSRAADSLSLQVEGGTTRVAITQSVLDPAGVANLDRQPGEIAFDAVAGGAVSLTKFVGVASSRDGSDPLPAAQAAVQRAVSRGYGVALDEHESAWKALWQTDVIVEGDPDLQGLIHAMQFYLLSSIREESGESLPPMGLSSAGFYGHVFWDADTWMFPPLAVMHPTIARSIVDFRSRTLAAAQRNATTNGYRGAMYPWEADERGEESTPRFAAQNARGEIHISGDVALAQWQYYLATGDAGWLAREGFPVIKETADFWVSRVTHDGAADQFHIRNVVSVDESLIGIDDDAYTNAVARRNLEIALAASQVLGQTPDPAWAQVAAKLYIPYDSEAQRHRTYENAPARNRSSAVPLLAYPLSLPMSEAVKRNDLVHTVEQHADKWTGAMMSGVLYPVVAAELGDQDLVDRLLGLTYKGHLRPPFAVLAERSVNQAVNFITGAGAFLQQVIFGYTGLRLDESGLRPAFKPVLPAGIQRIILRNFSVRGVRQDIIVDREAVRVVLKPASDKGLSTPEQAVA
jgi:trehalose/maltose hydrolase-like predicted phosphorylase